MHHLYLPVFIRDTQEKKEYNKAFSKIFSSLETKTKKWIANLNEFFSQKIKRIRNNANLIYNSDSQIEQERT